MKLLVLPLESGGVYSWEPQPQSLKRRKRQPGSVNRSTRAASEDGARKAETGYQGGGGPGQQQQSRGGTICGGHCACHARRTHRYNRWVPLTCSIHVTLGPRIHVPATVRRSGDAPAAGFSVCFPPAFRTCSLYQSCHLNPRLGTMASVSQIGLWNTGLVGRREGVEI